MQYLCVLLTFFRRFPPNRYFTFMAAVGSAPIGSTFSLRQQYRNTAISMSAIQDRTYRQLVAKIDQSAVAVAEAAVDDFNATNVTVMIHIHGESSIPLSFNSQRGSFSKDYFERTSNQRAYMHSDSYYRTIAYQFAEAHSLNSGSGCETRDCIVQRLVNAMQEADAQPDTQGTA